MKKIKITKITMPNCPKCNNIESAWNKVKENHPEIRFMETDISRDNDILIDLKRENIYAMPCFMKEIEGKETVFDCNISGEKDLEAFINE